MSRTCTRVGLTVVTLLAGLLLAAPRGHACSESECDLQPEQTRIRAELWQRECDRLDPSSLSPRFFGPDVRAPTHFVRGVCLFERISRGLAPYAEAGGRAMSAVESAIDELQKAQSTAMLPAQRTTAALFEGLMHCKQLDDFAAGKPPSMERRCFHRSSAKASFARVDLTGFTLTYADGEGAKERPERVVDALIACQERHLHQRETASCGMLLAPSSAELERIVDAAAGEVMPRYFGEDSQQSAGGTGLPPVTAMLARRLREAEAASEGSDDAFEALSRKNARIEENVRELGEGLCESGGRCLPPAVAELLQAYNAAIQTAITYTAFVRQSIEGLLLDERGTDVSAALGENIGAASDNVQKLGEVRSAIEALREDLTRLSVDSQGTATLRQACQLLFCEIYTGGGRLTNACRSPDPGSPSREPLALSNPLCQADPARQLIVGAGSGSATASSVCREAGFDPLLTDCSRLPTH